MRAATTVTMLRGLDAFADLTDDDLLVLADRARMEWVPPKTVLFHEGETDPWMFCLVEGSLVLTAADGRVHEITAGSAQAARPIARLKPRRYTARTLTPSRVVRIDASQLGDWAGASDGLSPDSVLVEEVDEPWPGQGAPGFEIEEIPEVVAEAATPAHLGHVAHLESGAIDLPSLPSIAMEARRIIDRDDTGVRTLAKVVLNDPAIAAKLIRVANSAVFHGKGTIESCERAITRLGLKTTRQLVVGFAMRELFKCDVPELQAEMVELWEHSAEVAAIAYVLARRLRIADPDEAQLAGLLHDIGAVPVLGYAATCPELHGDLDAVHALVAGMRARLGERVLREWNFSEAMVAAARDAESWQRESTEAGPDLADLVLVAQRLSLLGRPGTLQAPPLPRIPAFRRVGGDALDPEAVMALVAEADDQIRELRAILAG